LSVEMQNLSLYIVNSVIEFSLSNSR
jgi:hypothetical protein